MSKKTEWTTVRDGKKYPFDSDPNQVDLLDVMADESQVYGNDCPRGGCE